MAKRVIEGRDVEFGQAAPHAALRINGSKNKNSQGN